MNVGTDEYDGFDFDIEYRSLPATPSSYQMKKWQPTSSYNRTLKEVKEQATPGELYKKYYLEHGRQANILKVR